MTWTCWGHLITAALGEIPCIGEGLFTSKGYIVTRVINRYGLLERHDQVAVHIARFNPARGILCDFHWTFLCRTRIEQGHGPWFRFRVLIQKSFRPVPSHGFPAQKSQPSSPPLVRNPGVQGNGNGPQIWKVPWNCHSPMISRAFGWRTETCAKGAYWARGDAKSMHIRNLTSFCLILFELLLWVFLMFELMLQNKDVYKAMLAAMTMRNITMVHTLCEASCWSRIWL